MKRKSIRTSLSIITAIGIVLTTTVALFTTYAKLSGLVDISIQDHVEDFMETFKVTIDGLLEDTKTAATNLSGYEKVVKALEDNNTDELYNSVDYYYKLSCMKTDNITITDEKGTVIMRYYNDEKGDSMAELDYIKKAMNGELTSDISEGTNLDLGARTAAPIKNDKGDIIGVVAVNSSFTDESIVDTLKSDGESEFTILQNDVRINTTIKNGDKRNIGTKMDADIAKQVLQEKKEYLGETEILGKRYTVIYSPILDDAGEAVGSLFVGTYTDHIHESERNAIMICIVVGIIISVVIIALMMIYTERVISKPVSRLCADAQEMANGNLGITINNGPNNEIGTLAEALSTTVMHLREYVGDISENLNTMASGDMTIEITRDYVGDFASIKDSMNKISNSLNSTLSSINVAAKQVNSGSEQVAQGAQSLSQGATEQASSIEQLAASINVISNKVNTNADNAKDASAKAIITGEEMQHVSETMNNLVKAMEEIKASSDQTSNIIKTIDDIAFQTNILALNAAVEAARAGSVGKGFAVVADEVRNLAGKSAEAAKNTTSLIANTVSAIEKGSAFVEEVAEKISVVSNISKEVVDINFKISADSKDAADSITQITQGVDQISSVVQTNSATAQESAAASEELSGQANMLQNEISQFRLKENNGQASMLPGESQFMLE